MAVIRIGTAKPRVIQSLTAFSGSAVEVAPGASRPQRTQPQRHKRDWNRVSATTTSGERLAASRRQMPKEMAKILGDCRDLAIHRLLLSFTSMLDRVADLLMARAERTDVREEQALCLDARSVLSNEGAKLIADFERHLRQHIDDRMQGRVETKA